MDRQSLGVIVGICLAAFIVIGLLASQIFEQVPHSEDEVAYLFQAKVLAQNRLTVPTPTYPQAFWTPFVVDYQGQRFGKYPPGWPFLLSLGIRLQIPWLVNALLASLTLAMVAWLGARFYQTTESSTGSTPRVGLWAAGLGLVTPGFLFLSSSLLSHTASLFWTTFSLVTLFYLTAPHQKFAGRSVYAVLTGLALGAVFVTRPFAAAGVGLGIGVFLVALLSRREMTWSGLLWIGLGGLSGAALLPLYQWAISGDPTFNPYLLVWPYDRVGFGPDIGPYGYSLANAILINTHLKLMTLATGLFGWPGWSSLIFLPIPFLTRQANRWDGLLLSLLISLIGVHIFYWSFGGTDGGFPRYYYDALPSLLLLTARGIQIATTYLAGRSKFNLGWLPATLVTAFIAYNFIWNLPPLLMAQKGKYNITAAQVQAVEQAQLPGPALVIVKNVDEWSDFAAPFAANSPTLDGPVVYAIDRGPALTQKLRQHYSERTCWELDGEKLRRCPSEG